MIKQGRFSRAIDPGTRVLTIHNIPIDSQGYELDSKDCVYWGLGQGTLFGFTDSSGSKSYAFFECYAHAQDYAIETLDVSPIAIKFEPVHSTIYTHHVYCWDCRKDIEMSSEWDDCAICDCGMGFDESEIKETESEIEKYYGT